MFFYFKEICLKYFSGVKFKLLLIQLISKDTISFSFFSFFIDNEGEMGSYVLMVYHYYQIMGNKTKQYIF